MVSPYERHTSATSSCVSRKAHAASTSKPTSAAAARSDCRFEALSPEELKAQRKEAARLERNFREREKRRLAKAEREAEKNIVKESADAAVGSKRCAATDATKPGDSTSKPSSSSTSSRSASKRPRPPDFAAASCSCPWPCHNPAHRG